MLVTFRSQRVKQAKKMSGWTVFRYIQSFIIHTILI